MTLLSLITRHKNLSEKINKIEKERMFLRNFKHKTKLIDLKKEKLKIKDQIENWKD